MPACRDSFGVKQGLRPAEERPDYFATGRGRTVMLYDAILAMSEADALRIIESVFEASR